MGNEGKGGKTADAQARAATAAYKNALSQAEKRARADWAEVVSPAREVYLIQVMPARRAYLEALAAAWGDCDEAIAKAWLAFKAAEAPIREPYIKAMNDCRREGGN